MSGDDLKPLRKPADWDELYDGAFLKASHLAGQRVTLKIKSVDLYALEGQRGKEIKGALEFEERAGVESSSKLFSVNKINGLCLRAMFGRELQKYVGKRITLYPDKVREAGKMQGDPCVRIWGSPDIATDLDVTIHLRKRSPYTLTMHKITSSSSNQPKTEAGAREPGSDG
jgi:hypothetical protein